MSQDDRRAYMTIVCKACGNIRQSFISLPVRNVGATYLCGKAGLCASDAIAIGTEEEYPTDIPLSQRQKDRYHALAILLDGNSGE